MQEWLKWSNVGDTNGETEKHSRLVVCLFMAAEGNLRRSSKNKMEYGKIRFVLGRKYSFCFCFFGTASCPVTQVGV